MKVFLYHVWEKQFVVQERKEGEPEYVYVPKFSTHDREFAISVCENPDGRYVFTTGDAFYGGGGLS